MLPPVSPSRLCLRCRQVLSLEEFNRSAEFGRQFYCRRCQRAWYREHRAQHIANVVANTARYRERNAQVVLNYLVAHPCVDCGETDPIVLEFDHLRDKAIAVSTLRWSGATPERIQQEIAKCEIRCVNCHLRRTAIQRGWQRGLDDGGRRSADTPYEMMIRYLTTHPCVDCGEGDIRVLQFDHVDPTTKVNDVCNLVRRQPWPETLKEIDKCVVRCGTCHKRKTMRNGDARVAGRRGLAEDPGSWGAQWSIIDAWAVSSAG